MSPELGIAAGDRNTPRGMAASITDADNGQCHVAAISCTISTAYEIGIKIPPTKSHSCRRDRVGRGDMGDRLVLAVRADDRPRPTASRLPSLSSRHSARRSRWAGLRRKLMLRLVVTASGTGPIEARMPTYIAKSASAIMVGPEMVPPGRMNCVLIGLPDPAAAVPDVLDREAAAGVEHLRELRGEEALQARRPSSPLRACMIPLARFCPCRARALAVLAWRLRSDTMRNRLRKGPSDSGASPMNVHSSPVAAAPELLREDQGPIAILTLNRPRRAQQPVRSDAGGARQTRSPRSRTTRRCARWC